MEEEECANEIPYSLNQKMTGFDKSLGEVESILKPFLKIPITDMRDKIADPLQNAKLDLMVAYATNSLFWTYLITQGVDPKTHPIKDELLRIKQYIGKVQQIEDKKKMARVDTHAVKRFVRNALWEAKDSKESPQSENPEDEEQGNDEEVENEEQQIDEEADKLKTKKRKRNKDDDKKNKKKKKKKSKQD